MKHFGRLRRQYKPEDARVLFVGESPPTGGTFFYEGNSVLYYATEEAFLKALPEIKGKSFLDSFKELGCYLDDLGLEPVNRLPDPDKRRERRDGESGLRAG